ncbi:TPA: hypothetical protein SMF87_004524 [Serratia marcescens]|nr:hypothetical protein [Serratia marcescens]
MRNAILLLCVVLAAGCDKIAVPTGVNSANSLTRYVDKENGVICYQSGNTAVSCVKLAGGERERP